MNVNYAVIGSTLALMADSTHPDFSALGITKAAMDKATGDTPWTLNDKISVINTFKAVVYSATDALGLERVTLSPEFTAAAIVSLVHPRNVAVAAHWIAQDIKTGVPIVTDAGEEIGFNKTSVSMLVNLCQQAMTADGAEASRKAMLTKMAPAK
jgi:hypothetical protein